jgi:transcriptional regulator with XRE-family HTH domain
VIRRLRREREITQAALSAAVGYSTAYISLTERGLLRPSERFEIAAGEALGVPRDRLFASQETNS